MTGCGFGCGITGSSSLHDVRTVEQLIVRMRANIHSWIVFIAVDLLIIDAKVGVLSVICRGFVYRKIWNGECQPGKE